MNTFPGGANIQAFPTPEMWLGSKAGAAALIDESMRNLVINGDMRIDQRNEGGLVSVAAPGRTKSVDKWGGFGATAAGVFSLQRVTSNLEPGFQNSLAINVTTIDAAPAAATIYTLITGLEGLLMQKTAFGTAAAATVSLSFWINSSVTGTFCGNIVNSAGTRSYVFQYTIAAAGVWQQIQIIIPGETSGTWVYTNLSSLFLNPIDLGSGSNFQTATPGIWLTSNFRTSTTATRLMATIGATVFITGVQFEVNPAPTAYDYTRIELQLVECQRYYSKSFAQGTVPAQNVGTNTGETICLASKAGALGEAIFAEYPVIMRATPTLTSFNPSAANAQVRDESVPGDCSATAFIQASDRLFLVACTGNAGTLVGNALGVHWTADADI